MNAAPTLTTADHAELDRLLAGDLTFIDHSALHGPNAHARLFTDAPTIPLPDTSWLVTRMSDAPFTAERMDRLSPLHEAQLFTQFNYCRLRASQLADTARAGDNHAGGDLLCWHRQAIAIRNRIVEWFLPLTLHLAGKGDNGRKFRIDGFDFDDIVSEAMRALISAVELHDFTRGPLVTYASVMIRGAFSHMIDKVRPYRRVYRADLENGASDAIAGHVGDESTRRWKDEQTDERHAHLVEMLRIVLDENRAGLSGLERAILEARYREATGLKPLTPIDRIAASLHKCAKRVREVLRGVMGKLRAALDRATEMTKAAQLIIARRLRSETEVAEAAEVAEQQEAAEQRAERLRAARRCRTHQQGAWGAHLMSLAAKAGIHSYQQLATAIGSSAVHAWRMIQHNTMPPLRQSTSDALCKALDIEPDRLALEGGES